MTGIGGIGTQQLGGPESGDLLQQLALMLQAQKAQQLNGLSGSLNAGAGGGGCQCGCCSGGGCGGGCCGAGAQAVSGARSLLG